MSEWCSTCFLVRGKQAFTRAEADWILKNAAEVICDSCKEFFKHIKDAPPKKGLKE